MDNFKFNFLSRGQLESLNLDKFLLTGFKTITCHLSFSGNLIFAIIARMLCGNHLNFLLVHPSSCVGQICCSSASPAQSSPLFAGGGLVQVLVRFLEPWRQYLGSVHALQDEYADHPPLTAPVNKWDIIKKFSSSLLFLSAWKCKSF